MLDISETDAAMITKLYVEMFHNKFRLFWGPKVKG